MRLTIRAKQIAGVTAIVGLTVIALSVLHVARVSGVVLLESEARAQFIANAVLHRAREVVTSQEDAYAALRDDPGTRSILEAAIYGENVTGAAIVDTRGVVVAHSDAAMVGRAIAPRPALSTLTDGDVWTRLREVYAGDGRTLEVSQPLELGNEAFGAIRVGVSTILLREALGAWLRPAILTGVAALAVGVFVAGLLARALLRPIHVIRSGLTKLERGEFGVQLDLPEGDEFGELGAFFDTVSRQLSADRATTQGEKRTDAASGEQLQDAIALFGPSRSLLFANAAMLPVTFNEAVGREVAEVWGPDHPYRRMVEEAYLSGRSKGPVHVSWPELPGADDGHADFGDFVVTTHVIRGADGGLTGVMLVARNLAMLAKMRSTVAYSRKLVALGRLTAGIAHEVKNPLNAMMIHLELLRTKIGALAANPQPDLVSASTGTLGLAAVPQESGSGPILKQLEHVEVIEREIRRLDRVVQGLLRFTRPEDLRLAAVSAMTLFDEILPLIEPEATSARVRCVVECPSPAPVLNGDVEMLRQVFLNLALNACQAMPQGGTLRFAAAPADGDRVELRVEDTGVGIPPEHLDRIFNLYFTTKPGGTGMGLAMAFRIVQMHDGEIEVESTPGRGTTFRVFLPRAQEA